MKTMTMAIVMAMVVVILLIYVPMSWEPLVKFPKDYVT